MDTDGHRWNQTDAILSINTKLQIKTLPLTPLLSKERGNKAQLYWGEVIRMNATRYKEC